MKTILWNSQSVVTVYKSPFLPTEGTVPATNIETRKEVRVLSGEMVHAFSIDRKILFVSEEMYNHLQGIQEGPGLPTVGGGISGKHASKVILDECIKKPLLRKPFSPFQEPPTA